MDVPRADEPNPFTIGDPAAPAPGAAPDLPAGNAVPAADSPPPPPRALLGGLRFAWRARRALLLVVLVQLIFGLSIATPLRAPPRAWSIALVSGER